MCFTSKSPCCNTSVAGVCDPFTFLARQHFDEVDGMGWMCCKCCKEHILHTFK